MRPQPAFARAWLQQRQAGARAVAAVEAEELRSRSAADALRDAEALLSAAPIALMLEGRHATSGLVEQQRLFLLARR